MNSISSLSSPFTDEGFTAVYYTGLTPGTATAAVYGNILTGTVLTYKFNSQILIAQPF